MRGAREHGRDEGRGGRGGGRWGRMDMMSAIPNTGPASVPRTDLAPSLGRLRGRGQRVRVRSTVRTCIADGEVSKTKALKVVSYNDWRIKTKVSRNGAAHACLSSPRNEVVQRALDALEKQDFGAYDAVSNNCEHFAVYCKTGNPKSVQVPRWTRTRTPRCALPLPAPFQT